MRVHCAVRTEYLSVIQVNFSVYSERCESQRHNKPRRFQLLFVGNLVVPKSTVAAAVALPGRCAEHNGLQWEHCASPYVELAAVLHGSTRSS